MNAHPSARGQTVPQLAVALGAIAVVGVAFAMLVSNPPARAGGGVVKPSPSAPIVATPRPSDPASPSPSSPTKPSASPSENPSPDPVSVIELESASGHDVKADVIDQIGSLVSARSGKPGDGMSARWHDSIVRQAGPNAIAVTWVAFARDEHIGIGIHDLDGPLTVVVVQAGPYADTDALGEDRVVILTFDHPVVASDVAVEILDRTVDE